MYITNPPIPYCGSLGTRLVPGSVIRISGRTYPSTSCFAINLQCGPSVSPRDDVALHLSPVFSGGQPRIVRNTILANRWDREESFGGFPLVAGSAFEIVIRVDSTRYRLAIGGVPFTEFRHRLPFDRVSHLAVDGDVMISLIALEHADSVSLNESHRYPVGNASLYPEVGFRPIPVVDPFPPPPPPPPPPYSSYGTPYTNQPSYPAGYPSNSYPNW